MVFEKMVVAKKKFPNELILTADTVVYVGRRIIDKTNDKTEALHFLKFYQEEDTEFQQLLISF